MRDLLRKAYLENNGLCWQGRDQVRRQSAEFGTAGALGGPLASPADSKSQGLGVTGASPARPPLLPRVPAASAEPTVAPAHDELGLQRVPRTINCCQTGETHVGGCCSRTGRGSAGARRTNPKRCRTR